MTFKVGAAFFSDPKMYDPTNPTSGYRYVFGETGTPINGTGDLPSDVCWITNVDFDRRRDTRLTLNPGVYGDSYWRTKVHSLLLELGVSDLPVEKQAMTLAQVFTRIAEMGSSIWGINSIPADSYSRGIKSAIGHYQPKQSRDVLSASNSAVRPYSACQTVKPKNCIFTSVVLPRYQHCKFILDSGLPMGEFKEIPKEKLVPAGERLGWLCQQDEAYMAEVRITRIAPTFNALFNNGGGSGRKLDSTNDGTAFVVNDQRHIFTAPELDAMRKVADLEVERVWMSDEAVSNPYTMKHSDKKVRIGYSYGLLCENYWTSLSFDQSGNWSRTPLTAWLYAQDRVRCLEKASVLAERGFAVLGFGVGRINLAISPDQTRDLQALCSEIELTPAVGLSGPSSDVVLPGDPTVEQMVINLHTTGQVDQLMKYDDLVSKLVVNEKVS